MWLAKTSHFCDISSQIYLGSNILGSAGKWFSEPLRYLIKIESECDDILMSFKWPC